MVRLHDNNIVNPLSLPKLLINKNDTIQYQDARLEFSNFFKNKYFFFKVKEKCWNLNSKVPGSSKTPMTQVHNLVVKKKKLSVIFWGHLRVYLNTS